MAQGESRILAAIRLALGQRSDVRLFRNDAGLAWHGRLVSQQGRRVVLENAHRFTYGLQPGAGDLIGWRTVTITPDMVGQQVAVFSSVEVKPPGKGPKPNQRTWRDNVLAAGGFAGTAHTPEEAEAILRPEYDNAR